MTDKTDNAAFSIASVPAYLLFAVIAAAPLPFGSVDYAVIAFWCIALGIILVGLSFGPLPLRKGHLWILSGVGILILAYAFVLHEQLADHPWIASPHPVWAKASEALGVPITPSASIVRGEPFFALGASLANMLALICGLIVGADRARARQMFQVVAWAGVAYAVYGVLSFLIDPTSLLWREKRFYLGSVTGPFVNRNTAAAFFGSCAVIWFGFLLEKARRRLPDGPLTWRKVPRRLLSNTPRDIVIAFVMMFVCLMAMFMTGSRAGVILSLFALIVIFTIYLRRDLPSRSGVWIALAVGGVLAVILLEFMGGVVSSRLDLQGLADEGRFEAYLSTLRMIADRPWFGTGLGTFAWAFPAYRSSDVSMQGVWDIAHNTPLELAAELGVPLALLAIAAWLVAQAILIHGVRVRRRDVILPLAAFSMCLIAALHSCIDFTLQIPGYSIVLFGLLGAGLAQSFDRNNSIKSNA
jgi:O-antigen ligase